MTPKCVKIPLPQFQFKSQPKKLPYRLKCLYHFVYGIFCTQSVPIFELFRTLNSKPTTHKNLTFFLLNLDFLITRISSFIFQWLFQKIVSSPALFNKSNYSKIACIKMESIDEHQVIDFIENQKLSREPASSVLKEKYPGVLDLSSWSNRRFCNKRSVLQKRQLKKWLKCLSGNICIFIMMNVFKGIHIYFFIIVLRFSHPYSFSKTLIYL